MKTVQGLFDEFSAALQFPPYFGDNWPAFHECLSELNWLPLENGILMLITSATELLSEAPSATMNTFARSLHLAVDQLSTELHQGQDWDRPAVPVQIVFEAEEGQIRSLHENLTALEIQLSRVQLDVNPAS